VPSYTVGYIDVYRNGVRLVSTDFTATTGTTVVLVNACTSGDSVVTESFLVSSVLNAIPNSPASVGSSNIVSGVTLTAPVISTISNTGTLTLPTTTGTIALTSQITTQTSIIVSYVVGPTTDGGSATGGTTQTRPLNTVNYNGISGASLASNTVTLPAGDYFVNAIASAFIVGQFRYLLRNTTASTYLVLGTPADASSTELLGNLLGQFTLSVTSDVQLQMYCNNSRGGDGMGTNGGGLPAGVNSVYAVMQITKF